MTKHEMAAADRAASNGYLAAAVDLLEAKRAGDAADRAAREARGVEAEARAAMREKLLELGDASELPSAFELFHPEQISDDIVDSFAEGAVSALALIRASLRASLKESERSVSMGACWSCGEDAGADGHHGESAHIFNPKLEPTS